MAERAKPDERRSRKGRDAQLHHYYEGVLSRLIQARKECGLTQREASEHLGRSHSFMNKCESGERAIDVAELWALSRLYKKPLSFFAPDDLTDTF